MKRPVLLSLMLASAWFPPCPAPAQQPAALPQDTIAKFGSNAITARELIHRIESMPFPGIEKASKVDEVKLNALHAMIAEKLLGQEAKRVGLAQDERTKQMIRELENLFIRDALYKKEVSAKAHPTEDEIYTGMSRLPYELRVLSFLVGSRAQGDALAKKLLTAKPQSVLNLPSSLFEQVDTITIRFGAPDTTFEDAAFAIGKSRVSKPFLSPNFGWAVLYLLDRIPNSDVQKLNLAERRRRVERIVRERHEAKLAADFYYDFLKNKRANSREKFFTLLADSISALWEQDTVQFSRKDGYILSSELVEIIIERLHPVLDSTLVSMDDGELTVGQVLEMLRYEDWLAPNYAGEEFLLDLNEELKNLAAKEMLARKGRNDGFLSSPSVQSDLGMWTDYLAAGALYNLVRDSVTVTEEDIIHHLVKNAEVFGRYYEVNVREVLRDSPEGARTMLDELRNGRDFAELAAVYSTRGAWARQNGESGYFQVGESPEIGFRALIADSLDIVGPVGLQEGWSVFSVLGKRATSEALTSFDSLKHNVRVRLLGEKRKDALDRVIADLARQQQVAVDLEKVRRVSVSLIPTFTRRHIGFGGRMTAVPLLMQQWDWVKKYQPAEKLP